MPSEAFSFAERFARFRAGQLDDETVFLNEYIRRLMGLARSQLHLKIRQDAEDVVQSVMASFVGRHTEEGDLNAAEGLWDELFEITLRHCNKWNKRVQRQRHSSADITDHGNEPADDEPTPAEAAELADLVGWLMQSLRTPQERLILTLFLQGQSAENISGQVGMSDRTTYRTISHIKQQVAARINRYRTDE